MVIRFFVAVVATLFVLPFLAALALSFVYPETPIAVDFETWAIGLFPIVVGWLLFFSPALIPGVSRRYSSWAARVTGLRAVAEGIVRVVRALRAGARRIATETTNRLRALQSRTARSTLWNRSKAPAEPAPSGPDDPDSVATSPIPAAPTSEAPSSPPTDESATARFQTHFNGVRDRLSRLSADPGTHVDAVRETVRSWRDRMTAYGSAAGLVPAELNAYTLESFAHLKQIARLAGRSLDLSSEESRFVETVFAAVPQPLLPGEDEHPESGPLVYPEALRADLIASAALCRAHVTEEDMARASEGDLERALKVALAVLQVADHRRRRASERAAADPLLVLGPNVAPEARIEDAEEVETAVEAAAHS